MYTTPNVHHQVDISITPLGDPLAPNALGNVVAPHGIIGQSWDGDNIKVDGAKDNLGQLHREQGNTGEVTNRAQAEGAIEGTMEDYLMDDAFSTEFKYSRWGVVAAEPRDVSKLMGAKKGSPVSLAGTLGDEVASLDL